MTSSDDDLPREARVLLQRISCEIGGLEPLGAAAQGDWCAAIGQEPSSGRDRLKTHMARRLDRVTSTHPKILWIAPAGGRWKRQAQSEDDVVEGGDACVGLRRDN